MFEVGQSSPIINTPSTTGSGANTQAGSVQPVSRDDSFTQIGNTVSAVAAGGAASFKYSSTFSNSLKTTITDIKAAEGGMGKVKASLPGVKSIGMTTLKAGGIGALVSGAISAISNGVDVLRGKKTGAEAVSTFAADTANGTVSAK